MRAKALALALVLLWGTGARAAQDFDGSTGHASSSAPEFTAEPFSVACWVRADNDTATHSPFGLGDTAVTTTYFSIFLSGGFGDLIQVRARDGVAGAADANTSTVFSANVWHNVVGVWASSTSRAAYIDGGSKGTNTDSRSVTSTDTVSLGRVTTSTPGLYLDGKLAECGFWNVALTDAEVATLGKGFAPPCVRRASLVAYYPMVRDTTSLKDRFSATANNLTLAGTTAVADHPRINNCQ